MNHSHWTSERWQTILLFCIGLAILPALLINLGDLTFIDDEGIRSLVALEMTWRGEWVQATLNGEPYFKKPPLYNWFLAFAFWLAGEANESVARSTTVFFLISYLLLVFGGVRREIGSRGALLVALFTLTCGRILFWDSFLGLIDICFSAVVFGNFLLLYRSHQARRWWVFFLGSWTLTILAFLLKGLPALVFQGLTVIGLLAWHRQWRTLFHPAQFAGGGLFLLVIGAYYVRLLDGADAATIFGTLFHESAQRTPTHHSLWKVLGHVVIFPFEMTYHFLPWSLLGLFLIRPRKSLRSFFQQPFAGFLALALAVNLPIYWISPQVFPRYLLMFLPAYFTLGWLAWQDTDPSHWLRRGFSALFLGVGTLLLLVSWLPLILPQTADTPGLILKTAILISLLGVSAWAMWRQPRVLFWALILQLLCLRIALNWFATPDRVRNDHGTTVRSEARRIGTTYAQESLYYWQEPAGSPTTWFYLNEARQGITPVWRDTASASHHYLVRDPARIPTGFVAVDSFAVRHHQGDKRPIFVVASPQE